MLTPCDRLDLAVLNRHLVSTLLRIGARPDSGVSRDLQRTLFDLSTLLEDTLDASEEADAEDYDAGCLIV